MFKRGPLLGVRLTLLIIVAMVLMLLDHRHDYLSPLRKGLSVVVSPVQYVVNIPIDFFDEIHASLRSRRQLERDNAKLRAEQILLKARVQKLLAIETENTQLKSLLNSTQKSQGKLLVSELLAVDTNPFSHEAVLDKGSMEGVYVGQPVLDAYGVMGQVIAVSPFTSRILLISDERSGVPVEDSDSGVRAIAVGTGAAMNLSLHHVPETANVKVGDVMLTSGLGQRFPAGYPLGVISSIQRSADNLFATIQIKPFAHLNRSREVILVWPTHLVPTDALAKQLMAMDADKKIAVKVKKRVITP